MQLMYALRMERHFERLEGMRTQIEAKYETSLILACNPLVQAIWPHQKMSIININ